MATHILVRGDTASNWVSINPIPLNRELCFETDTNKFKMGDGSTAWNNLKYVPFTSMTRIALSAIGGFKVVREAGNGLVAYASSDDAQNASAVAGVTLGAAGAGAPINLIRHGEILDPTLALTPGPLFLGLNGGIVSAPPTSGVLLQVGVAGSNGQIIIDIQLPILR